MGNNQFQDIETDVILHLITYQSETFHSLGELEEDITSYQNNYLSVERNAVHMFDEKMEKRHERFRSKVVASDEILYDFNSEAEKYLQINLIRLETNEMMDAVYEGYAAGESKRWIKEIHHMRKKIEK